VHYGGIRAVAGVDLDIAEGELVCLIGANGAGKTSTLKAICGLIGSRSGNVRYRGEDISRAPVHELPRKGLVMVPEATAAQYERFPRLAERRRQIAGTLSGGEQQMLALARALMTRPQLLLLDEPSMGLAPMMVTKIFDLVRDIAVQGVTILLVEQNARAALEIARRGYVMESGVVSLSGEARALLDNPRVREAYLGE